jgi:hypothetical protein
MRDMVMMLGTVHSLFEITAWFWVLVVVLVVLVEVEVKEWEKKVVRTEEALLISTCTLPILLRSTGGLCNKLSITPICVYHLYIRDQTQISRTISSLKECDL